MCYDFNYNPAGGAVPEMMHPKGGGAVPGMMPPKGGGAVPEMMHPKGEVRVSFCVC